MKPTSFRYQFQAYRGVRTRHNCPACGSQHRRTFTRFVDTTTQEILPPQFGRCNRENNCGYYVSPYHKGPDGTSYAEQVYQDSEAQVAQPSRRRRRPITPLVPPIVTIPDEVVQGSLTGYDQNQLARLLVDRFGITVANRLLRQFEIGTSSYWPGACVFWLRDHYQRVRGGQVVLFDADGHTAKQQRPDGTTRRCTSWAHTALAHAYSARHEVPPAWLDAYQAPEVEKSPCLFGVAQLATTEFKKPIMVVESPKTAVICAGFYPQYVWLAVNALSYLTPERLAPLKGRPVTLFPDASVGGRAFALWQAKAAQFKLAGFDLSVSDYLEQRTSDAQKAAGLDLADVLLADWPGYPPSWDEKE